ncbi:MAG: hypothetical protein WA977_08405 [Halobacteriota archaeon]
MKKLISPKDEARALTEGTTGLFESFLDNFAKYAPSGGCFKLSNESPRFIVTLKIESKKGAK